MMYTCTILLAACLTVSTAYVLRTGGSSGRGVVSQYQHDGAYSRRQRNPATGMLGAYNYDGQTYTSNEFMSIRQPYREAGGGGHGFMSSGLDYARVIPGYRRNQHLWAGPHQQNYRPIRDKDGWVRRYSTDRDEYRARLYERYQQERAAEVEDRRVAVPLVDPRPAARTQPQHFAGSFE